MYLPITKKVGNNAYFPKNSINPYEQKKKGEIRSLILQSCKQFGFLKITALY